MHKRALSPSTRRSTAESNPLLPRRGSFIESDAPAPLLRKVMQYVAALSLVMAAGVLGWALSGENRPRESPPSIEDDIGAKVLGYLSAALYLSARIPQILLNYKLKSTEGLSLLFFMFSTLGNVSFAASILFAMTGKDYLLLNLPWLIGSAGTIFFDFTVNLF